MTVKHMHLDPGKFRSRVTVLVNVPTADGYGGFIDNWRNDVEVWARIMPASGQLQRVADHVSPLYSHAIDLRQPSDVVAGNRLQVSGTVITYEVSTLIDPDGTGRYLRCACLEVLK